ncbi:MAG: hypothetical protein ACI30R_10070 [Sodaliphilus sp.]
MKPYVLFLLAWLITSSSSLAQDYREQYEKFKQQATKSYTDFRNEANARYVEFLKTAWESFQQQPAVKKPEEIPVPPVVLPDEERNKSVKVKPLLVDTVIKSKPILVVQPQPVSPIKPSPTAPTQAFHFTFYGTRGDVRLPKEGKDALLSLNSGANSHLVAQAWSELSAGNFDQALSDCLQIRSSCLLHDYAYLMMLRTLSESWLGGANNASSLLTAWLYCQSGYKMRLALSNGKVVMLFGAQQDIYDVPSYYLDGFSCYPLLHKGEEISHSIDICNASFPGEKALSLIITQSPKLAVAESEKRTITSKRYKEMVVNVTVNKNLMPQFEDYPPGYYDENFMTRWAMLANAPLNPSINEALSEQLMPLLKGKTQLEAANMLLNWVQTGFVYEYDNKVWGHDRAFFAEETLYYPYCDCEDRSILFSRLVRNLLGLKCVLVYYPNHLASAVCFTEQVSGDYLLVEGEKFVIADATFFNAPVGRTMPKMENATAKVIVLE